MVKVVPSNKQNKITVSNGSTSGSVSASGSSSRNQIVVKDMNANTLVNTTGNLAEQYSKVSKAWANSDALVEGEDYSSKYYANKSKEYAEDLNNLKSEVSELIESFDTSVETSINNINSRTQISLSDITTSMDEAITSVENCRDNSKGEIEAVTEDKKEELNDIADLIKENANDIINRVGWNMFDTVLKDHILTYEESRGLALQGTYVYKTAIAGERYGYPDFYAKCLEEYNEATATETVNGVTVKVHSNGHKFYDIANKTAIDDSFNSLGSAWFYGVDTENERIFLPRNDFFEQATSDTSKVGDSVEAGLPNIIGQFGGEGVSYMSASGAHYVGSTANNNGTGHTATKPSPWIHFDASRSSSVYGKSSTVQPNAVNKLLYICVGNQIQDTSWIDIVTQVSTGIKDINDVREESLADVNTLRENSLADVNTLREDSIQNIEDVTEDCIKEVEYRGAELRSKMALSMFDTILKDHILTYKESQGLALQGTYVYKSAIAGERYGYADFYNKCIEERAEAIANGGVQTVTLGGTSMSMYIHPNGHMYYDISMKATVDNWFNTFGTAWFYGVDTENERIFLPRNNYFEQVTGNVSEVGKGVEAGLPNITGGCDPYEYGWSRSIAIRDAYGAFYTTKTGSCINRKEAGSQPCGIGFDASRVNAIYGKSNTVQPNAVKKLLYICVGNTISDTSWVDVVTQVEGGVKDLVDATNEGLATLANASNALRQTQITNCLLEVPQNIKLELIDGTLTLKAGSKVIVPNGAGVFDEVITPRDYSTTFTGNGKIFLFYIGNAIGGRLFNECSSGTTNPATAGTAYYDTDDNHLYYYYASGTEFQASLPLAICTVENGAISSIDQVFNGMGYIGSTIWVDKGVKGLIPNGRNKDGTLNNIEFTTSKVLTATTQSGTRHIRLEANIIQTGELIYNETENINTVNGEYRGFAIVGTVTADSSNKITSFQPKLPFRAVDYNDIAGLKAYITETYQNGTSWYRIWSDKWCEQGGYISSGVSGVANGVVVTFLKPFLNSNYTITMLSGHTDTSTNNLAVQYGNSYYGCYQPSSKTANTIRLCGNGTWHACGYIA